MINIRYHIVSITAVFLALGIGVALGSTFLDRATVDLLENRIGAAEQRIDATDAENERLRTQLEQADERDASLIVLASEDLVADHLPDVPVLVIAAPGVNEDDLDALSTVLERTGAQLAGTVRLDDRLALEEVDEDLATDLGLVEPTAPELRRVVDDALHDALAAAAQPVPTDEAEPESPGGDDVPDGTQPEIVTTLAERGYLDIVAGPGRSADDPILEQPGYRYVLVGAPGLSDEQNGVLIDLVDDEGDEPLPAVVVAARVPTTDDGTELVPTVVGRIRADDALATRIATVDDADTFVGLLSAIYVLQQIDTIDVGHYGQADGATALLPPVP